jgi:hypothetical protein
MDQPTRLNPTSITLSVKRQTPKNDFGDVLANTLSGAVKTGGAILGSLGGQPIVSAAVSGITSVTNQLSSTSANLGTSRAAATGVVTLGGTTPNNGVGGSSAGTASGSLTSESGTYSNPDIAQMARMSDYYLNLQNQMQMESREYNAVSNISKIRHDSAKAAINNIR